MCVFYIYIYTHVYEYVCMYINSIVLSTSNFASADVVWCWQSGFNKQCSFLKANI